MPDVNSAVMTGLRSLADELGAGYEISALAFSPRGMADVQAIRFKIAELLAVRIRRIISCRSAANGFRPSVPPRRCSCR